jgi:hypothetical protein
MTAPVRHHQFGPGRRTPNTLLMLDERDRFLRSAAELYCDGMSRRRAAEWLHGKLRRYAGGSWRRDRESPASPTPGDKPKITALEPAAMIGVPAPVSIGLGFTPAPHDAIHDLPEAAARRLELLRERSDSAFRMCPGFDEVQLASTERVAAENVWKRMVEHPSNFGFGRAQDDPLSLAARKTADRAAAAFAKIQALYNKRGEEAQAASAALKACEDYLRSGRPGGTVFETVLAELPKLSKGESLVEAVEKMRRRVRELRSRAEQIAASQYPPEVTKQKMREQIMRLAEQNAPDVSLLIEHFREVVFPTESQRAEVIGAPVVVSTVIPCSTGLLCWCAPLASSPTDTSTAATRLTA